MGGELEGLLLQVSGILFLYVCCRLYEGKEKSDIPYCIVLGTKTSGIKARVND